MDDYPCLSLPISVFAIAQSFADFHNPQSLYQAIPMGPCAFNMNDRALLLKLMAHWHFCALLRNFNFYFGFTIKTDIKV